MFCFNDLVEFSDSYNELPMPIWDEEGGDAQQPKLKKPKYDQWHANSDLLKKRLLKFIKKIDAYPNNISADLSTEELDNLARYLGTSRTRIKVDLPAGTVMVLGNCEFFIDLKHMKSSANQILNNSCDDFKRFIEENKDKPIRIFVKRFFERPFVEIYNAIKDSKNKSSTDVANQFRIYHGLLSCYLQKFGHKKANGEMIRLHFYYIKDELEMKEFSEGEETVELARETSVNKRKRLDTDEDYEETITYSFAHPGRKSTAQYHILYTNGWKQPDTDFTGNLPDQNIFMKRIPNNL